MAPEGACEGGLVARGLVLRAMRRRQCAGARLESKLSSEDGRSLSILMSALRLYSADHMRLRTEVRPRARPA